MSLIFCDGFDNYDVQTNFWDFAGTDCSIRLNTGDARTGIGCLQINTAAFGPRKTFGHMTHMLVCMSWFANTAGECLRFQVTDNFGDANVRVEVNLDGSISFYNGQVGPLLAQTAAGLVIFSTYVSIAVKIQNFTGNTGIIDCWVNGALVLHATGLATAVSSFAYTNMIQLMGPGGIPNCFIDDVYVLNCSLGDNTGFLGALRLYALPPTANAAVGWTPLAAPNFSQVDEVPPDNDTSYNSSFSVGDADQYVYPLTGPPAGATLYFLQHELDMRIDTGSRSVASDLNGAVSTPAVALNATYHIYAAPYDNNPATGVQWVAGDFPVNAGPKVTA